MEYFDLDVWKESRLLVSKIYSIIKIFPSEERFGLTDQIRRSAVSVPSNIAEGCGRNTPNDKLRFFYISRGSLFELETQMFIALDLKYITNDEFKSLFKEINKCKKLLNGFIKYHKSLLSTSTENR